MNTNLNEILFYFQIALLQEEVCQSCMEKLQTADQKNRLEKVYQYIKEMIRKVEFSPEIETWPQEGTTYKDCEYYKKVTKAKRIVLRNIFRGSEVQCHDVTLVTQTNLARLDRLNRILSNWKGHISVAVHVTPTQIAQLISTLSMISINNCTKLHIILDLQQTVGEP